MLTEGKHRGAWLGVSCIRCAQRADDLVSLRCLHCGGPLELRRDVASLKEALSQGFPRDNGSLLGQWRALLPIADTDRIDKVSCGERESPTLRGTDRDDSRSTPLYLKLEYTGPSLSLKDRGTALCALKALELGYETLCVASSGNNAASVAAYAAKAGLRAVVFVQRKVSPGKLAKALAHGARIVRVDGTMSVASRICGELARRHRWFNCGGANPYRMASKRLVAYAVVAQLGRAPDVVAFPVGGGTGMASAYAGFSELLEMGLISQLPRMIGVQFEACDPVTRAFELGQRDVEPIEPTESSSDALMNGTPYWGERVLQAARSSAGALVSVSDDECRGARDRLASREGLFLELAGAISVAGVRKLRAQGRLDPSSTVVCMLTGHGANAEHDASADTVEVVAPDVSAIESYLAE